MLFLSEAGGPTLVLAQDPEGALADRGWLVQPCPNQLLAFPGNLLHGVIPGRTCKTPCMVCSNVYRTGRSKATKLASSNTFGFRAVMVLINVNRAMEPTGHLSCHFSLWAGSVSCVTWPLHLGRRVLKMCSGRCNIFPQTPSGRISKSCSHDAAPCKV